MKFIDYIICKEKMNQHEFVSLLRKIFVKYDF
jgi:hypothetical protein